MNEPRPNLRVTSLCTLRLLALCLPFAACGRQPSAADLSPPVLGDARSAAVAGANPPAVPGPSSGAPGAAGSGSARVNLAAGGAAPSGHANERAGEVVAGSAAAAARSTPESAGDIDAGQAVQDAATPSEFTAQIDEIASELADAVCAALRGCLGPAQLAALTAREPCEANIGASLRQDDFGTLDRSLSIGDVVIDPAKLDDCYRETRALGCALASARLPESCQLAIAGQRSLGERCQQHADCGAGTFCTSVCPRTCQPLGAAGASCTNDAECNSGLICFDNRCGAPAAEGAACGGNVGSICDLGASCVGGSQTTQGVCKVDRARQVGDLGASCAPDGSLCREGLSCAYDGNEQFTCQPSVSDAASCHLAVPGQCPVDDFCNAIDVQTSGTCEPLPSAGRPCVLGNQCAAGHICVAQGQLATCQRRADVGDPCVSDAVCRSGACVAGQCVVRTRCD